MAYLNIQEISENLHNCELFFFCKSQASVKYSLLVIQENMEMLTVYE